MTVPSRSVVRWRRCRPAMRGSTRHDERSASATWPGARTPRKGFELDGRLAELVPGASRTELQRMVLEYDWAATPLGPEEHWSPTLRTAVSTALNSRFGMLLMWGPELVMIYNDGYAPMLGTRHPTALGMRVPEVWVDVWDD